MSLYLGDIPIANDGLQRLTGEIGDIGIAPFGIDESLNLRRYLNGQIISQTQFEAFTNKVKSAIALYPNLAATEENWQAEVTASVLGQCGKFVVDDEAGTIRLPKVVNINGLQDLALIGGIKAESLPNITGNFGDNLLAKRASDTNNTAENINANGAFRGASVSNGATATAGTTSSTWFVNGRISLDASRSSAAYQDGANVQQEAIQYPYFIQVATGIEETLPAIREYKVNNSNFFGQSMWSDIDPKNSSWLASYGQYNASNLYPDLWTQLTGVELNTSLNVGDTIEINGKTYVKRGLPVVFSTDTVTDYDFVVNQNDQTFRLPLLNGSEDLLDESNTIHNPITGSFSSTTSLNYTATKNGFMVLNVPMAAGIGIPCNVNGVAVDGNYSADYSTTTFQASVKRGDVVSLIINFLGAGVTDGAHVESSLFIPYKGNGTLYYYVGDVVQDASLINAGAVLSDVVDLKQTTLRTNQITNCITEIPQDIKLELNNGTLTLKAGSKVYVPNGFEQDGTTPKFDYVTISSDITQTITFSGSYDDCTVCYNADTNSLGAFRRMSTEAGSGTDSITIGYYYNTSTNLVNHYVSSATNGQRYSLPLGLFSNSASMLTGVNNIFNGFGYIGSTVFALPGVKGLIPDGRNEDDSLRNIESTLTRVHTYWLNPAWGTGLSGHNFYLRVFDEIRGGFAGDVQPDTRVIYYSKGIPSSNYTGVYYDTEENKWFWVNNGAISAQDKMFIGATFTANITASTSSVAGNFTPKQPFQAVDRNDSSWLSGLGMPSGKYINLTLGATGSAYTAPANGYFALYVNKGNSTTAMIRFHNGSIVHQDSRGYGLTSDLPLYSYIPVHKGQSVVCSYNYTGTFHWFRFVYAEGETDV